MNITTTSANATTKIGLKLAKKLKNGQIFALYGDLGGGKTCFTKGLARGLGIKRRITSPTFVLMKVYNIKKGWLRHFCHVDAYRLKKPSDIIEVGLKEYLGRPDTVVAIEWADKLKKILKPYKKTVIKFSFAGLHERKIQIKKSG